MAESSFRTSRYQHEQRVAAAGWTVVAVFIAAAWLWAHHLASTEPQDSPEGTVAQATRPTTSMPTWIAESEMWIHGVVIARNNIAAAAAQHDLPATGAACRTATGAVENLHRHMPSPEPALTDRLQRAISSYIVGLPYCISATETEDGQGLQRAASYITEGDNSMQEALDMLGQTSAGEPDRLGMLIV